ncbi:ribonuclease H-like domain-containing protein [Tanacetum coccineum]|uniref:Ribonuclease H-like domain-containing protein n=1 Tax=Tanacetum coccineum TaxID=301880 RepID=A0ABQ4XBB4_9ASTR
MVAYLQKPEGSEAFHKIMDFLNTSHIKYALIENPKIYISLIQQFWGTTTARTTDDGEVEITASIDGQVKTITEASLRRHLKLEDSDGITSLPNTEIFEQLALIGFPQSQNPTQTQVAYGGLHFTSVDVDTRGAATTDIGLEAGQFVNKMIDGFEVTKLTDRLEVLRMTCTDNECIVLLLQRLFYIIDSRILMLLEGSINRDSKKLKERRDRITLPKSHLHQVMELESAQSNTTAKLPILKLENGNSWVSVPQTAQDNGTSVTKMLVPVAAEEKTNKKNYVKARSLLLMALPNEHQLTFSQYSDAKTMFVAIETRFGCNEATKKTQKTLLKQQYENFSASSTKSLNSIFNELQKVVSRLAILGVVINQEDLNSKFLRSLPPDWNTHVVVWMNKADIETMSIDDLYNFKIVEKDVKKSVSASSVSTVSPNINTACPQDLEKIHEDDLEAMDLKWQLSPLSMRAKRYFQRIGKKIFINANDTAGYDKSKVECFNCHKMGHFARECRAPRNKKGQFKYQDNTRKQGNNEDTSSKAMLVIDGVGFDWSDMAEEHVQTNMALMTFSDSRVYNDKTCTKTCLKNYETLKKQCDDLIVKLNQTEFTAAFYKRGLANVEDQLITYRKNEVLFSEEVAVLKREVPCKDYEINMLKNDSKENSDDSLVKEQVSEDTSSFDESSLNVDKETVFLFDKKIEFVKLKNHENQLKGQLAVVNAVRVNQANAVKASACWVWRPTKLDSTSITLKKHNYIDARGRSNGCSRNMTGNIAHLSDFKEFDGGYVTFGGGAHGGRISSKGTLKTGSLDFEDVYFVNELNFNLFIVSQMCEKKNYVLFTYTKCLVLSPDFKLPDESQILLKIPRKDNMYSFDMKNIVSKESLTCLVAKATSDESMLCHRRLGHINFKSINKLVKDNLVRGLPT